NMAANRWLFQHLTETLDRRMLAMLTKTDHLSISGDISFNINVATLLTSEFQDFDDNVAAARRGSMILELQIADIFSDLGGYLFAREYVREKGYRICLDGMTSDSLAMIDQRRLGVDLIKLFWHPDMVDCGEEAHEKIRVMIRRAGVNRIVLCRVDNREAIDFGQSVGLSIFQGRYVESLIAEDNRRRDLLRLKMRIERSDELDG
ncbi:MAG TPA: EAL domain-containing protein, partial [Alphaproteobacteria bacterium]|nr:EAL domain-containing protein [Alphaproteobacteria bacterium]